MISGAETCGLNDYYPHSRIELYGCCCLHPVLAGLLNGKHKIISLCVLGASAVNKYVGESNHKYDSIRNRIYEYMYKGK